jgi:hypothetical protein
VSSYRVDWREAREYAHPFPERTARVGNSSGAGIGGGESYTFRVYPTRDKMLDAYYKHGQTCGIMAHACIQPLVRP